MGGEEKEEKKGRGGGGGGARGDPGRFITHPPPPPFLFRSANAISRDHWENEFPQKVETEEGKNYFNDRQ